MGRLRGFVFSKKKRLQKILALSQRTEIKREIGEAVFL